MLRIPLCEPYLHTMFMVQAVMFYPTNNEVTESERFSYFNALRISHWLKHNPQGTKIQLDLLDAASLINADNKLFSTKYKKAEKILLNGFIAGNCLYVLSLLNNVLENNKASPELAWYCVECALRDGRLALPFLDKSAHTKEPESNLGIDVRKRWLQFKPVSHLWCAMFEFPDMPIQLPFIFDYDDGFFINFMSIAESWAQWGLSHGSKKGGPFLNPDTTWRAPEGMPTKKCTFEDGEPTPEILQYVEEYKEKEIAKRRL